MVKNLTESKISERFWKLTIPDVRMNLGFFLCNGQCTDKSKPLNKSLDRPHKWMFFEPPRTKGDLNLS